MSAKLNTCPFCKSKQLEVVQIDMKDPDRDLIKCRHCKGQVMRYHWNDRHITLEQAKKIVEDSGMVCLPADPPDYAMDILKRLRDGELGNAMAYRMIMEESQPETE